MFDLARAMLCVQLALAWPVAQALELVTEENPPQNMSVDGKVVGVATEKLEQAFQRSGIDQRIALMPWARAYRSALTQPDHCVFSTARTREREQLFKWIGPVAITEWVLYARAGDKKPARLAEVRNKRIGGYEQDVISEWLAARGYRVDSATTDAVNPKKLLLGRIEYWASSRPRATVLLAKEGLTEQQIVPVLTFGHTELYLACHHSTPAKVVHRLNQSLRQMNEDGTSARIDARYARWPAR